MRRRLRVLAFNGSPAIPLAVSRHYSKTLSRRTRQALKKAATIAKFIDAVTMFALTVILTLLLSRFRFWIFYIRSRAREMFNNNILQRWDILLRQCHLENNFRFILVFLYHLTRNLCISKHNRLQFPSLKISFLFFSLFLFHSHCRFTNYTCIALCFATL